MSDITVASIGRQTGLLKELEVVANNLANSSTTGYKADRAVFAELLVAAGATDESLSLGTLAGHAFELEQGDLKLTQGRLDLAIQGDGFFQVETPRGNRLTRAGHFSLSPEGQIIDPQGNPVLSEGGTPINIPDDATEVVIAQDGSLSIDGALTDRIGVFSTTGQLQRDTSTYFTTDADITSVDFPTVIQGALEGSNVSPVIEVARMIEVQRAYEAGQALLEQEDQRLSQLVSTIRDR
ncbi:MAG: flagellar hook-basal body complex protein [Pseudomonadota bacterium]